LAPDVPVTTSCRVQLSSWRGPNQRILRPLQLGADLSQRDCFFVYSL